MEVVYIVVGYCLATVGQWLTVRALRKVDGNSDGQLRLRLAKPQVNTTSPIPSPVDAILGMGGKIRNAKDISARHDAQ